MRTIEYRLLLLLITITSALKGQNITFSDSIFKERLIEIGIDLNFDNEISFEEASKVKSLNLDPFSYCVDCEYNYIQDLSDIAYFGNLKNLDFSNNQVTYACFLNNDSLEYIDCSGNNLDSINLNNLHFLQSFICFNNPLEQISFSNNTDLNNLQIGLVYLNSLNLQSNPNLKYLHLTGCHHLDSFSLLQNVQLINLTIRNTNISGLNLSTNDSLESLNIIGNYDLSTIEFSDNYEMLENANISENKISHLNLSSFKNIKSLDCSYNNIKTISLDSCKSLEIFNCRVNHIDTILFTNNLKLKTLDCNGNQLRFLNVGFLDSLVSLSCATNQINTLLLSRNLKEINCNVNNLSKLDLDSLDNIEIIDCNGNKIQKLDLSNKTKLHILSCFDNEINELVIDNAFVKKYQYPESYNILTCDNNKLVSVDITSMGIKAIASFRNIPSLETICVSDSQLNSEIIIITADSPDAKIQNCSLTKRFPRYPNYQIQIFPTLIDNSFKVTIRSITFSKFQLRIISPDGKVMLNNTLTEKENIIDISNFKNGLYICEIKFDNFKSYKQKIIKY